MRMIIIYKIIIFFSYEDDDDNNAPHLYMLPLKGPLYSLKLSNDLQILRHLFLLRGMMIRKKLI